MIGWLTLERTLTGAVVALAAIIGTTACRLRVATLRQHLDAAARRERTLLAQVDWQKTQLDAALMLAPELDAAHARRLTLIVTDTPPAPTPATVPAWWTR